MYRSKLEFIVLISLLVAACSSMGGRPATFDSFLAEVKLAAGAGATDCGHMALGADRSVANCCVAINFIRSLPFSVSFDEQGIDSRVARGLMRNVYGTTTLFYFDSDPSGGYRQDSGVVYSRTCKNPTLTQNPCGDPVGFPLNCE